MKKIYIATALAATITLYIQQNKDVDELTIENVEALSYNSEVSPQKVSDIIETYDENTEKRPDSTDNNGNIISWKDEVVSITHTVQCASTAGELTCTARNDIHSKDIPDYCPGEPSR